VASPCFLGLIIPNNLFSVNTFFVVFWLFLFFRVFERITPARLGPDPPPARDPGGVPRASVPRLAAWHTGAGLANAGQGPPDLLPYTVYEKHTYINTKTNNIFSVILCDITPFLVFT